MASIQTIQSTDVIANSRADINTNFENLNNDKIETSYLDTDTSLTENSDSKIATQKAVKTYVDASVNPTGRSWNEYAADAGSTDAYAITLSGVGAYVTGQTFKFKANTANTGACTLNVNSLGAKTIKKDVTSDLVTGDILANQIVEVIYDGTNMQLISKSSLAQQYTSVFRNGATTYDVSTANGTQTIAHGAGLTPSVVRITAVMIGNAVGVSYTYTVYSNSTQSSVSHYVETGSSTSEGVSATFRIVKDLGAGDYTTGVVTVDATNISIAWTKNGSPIGTANLLWEVQY